MPITRIASQDATITGTHPSVTATYPATPTQGNLLLAVVGCDTGSGSGPSLTGWTFGLDSTFGSAEFAVFYKIAGASESTSVTVNNADTTAFDVAIFEYGGWKGTPSSPANSAYFAATVATGLSITTGSTTTFVGSDRGLVIAGAMWPFVSQTLSSWSNNFNSLVSLESHLFVSDRLITAVNSFSTVCTVTGTSSGAAAGLLVFIDTTVVKPGNIGASLSIGDGASRAEVMN